jgi:hypothetical protein
MCPVVTNLLIWKLHSVSIYTVIRTSNDAHLKAFRKLWITFGYEKGSLKHIRITTDFYKEIPPLFIGSMGKKKSSFIFLGKVFRT